MQCRIFVNYIYRNIIVVVMGHNTATKAMARSEIWSRYGNIQRKTRYYATVYFYRDCSIKNIIFLITINIEWSKQGRNEQTIFSQGGGRKLKYK